MGNSTSGPQNMLYCFLRFQSISVNSMPNFMHLVKNPKRINSFLIIILLRCFLNLSQATGKQFVCLSTTKITSTGRQVAFSIPENIYNNLNWTKFHPYWIQFQWRRKNMPQTKTKRNENNENKSLDGIPARLLKECSQQIAPNLCSLFNLSLQSSWIPSEWKSADVPPIHKKDSKEPAENYRPISLLSIVSKVLERCVYYRFHDHILHHISQAQHGFLRKRSCVTQLLSVFHTIGHDLDKNIQTDVLHLDFVKAFDSVDHRIVLEKLRGYGVTGSVMGWYADYLNGRTQRVVVDGVASTWSPVTSGVPQGSTHGPLLFVIFINDFPDVVQNGRYADDTKLHNTITSTDDCKCLQQSLTNLNCSSVQNNIRFNASKCKVPTITRKKISVTYDYNLGTESLTRVDSEKDLGVITSSGLSWELQINCVISKANKMLRVLKRTCTQLTDMKARRTLYLTHVKSQLRYATEVCSPVKNIQLSKRVERVQRRATRWIIG